MDFKDPSHPPKRSRIFKLFNELHLLGILTFFAIVGVLARKGITVLTTYPGAYVGGVVWANFSACLIMGAAIQSKNTWEGHDRARQHLFIGITTGFCGTFSSFSSMILEAFVKSADIQINHYYHYKTSGYGILEFASVILTHTCLSIGAFHFGKHLIKYHDPKLPHFRLIGHVISVLGLLSWMAVIALISVEKWRSWIFACIVSPIACWLRYYISKKMNPIHKKLPLGTLTVNAVASGVMGILNLVNRGKTTDGRIVNTVLSCHMIQGLEDGFCGTLSTVSTWVNELYGLKSPFSYRYGAISVALCYSLVLVSLGSYNWTKGLVDPLCS